MPRFLFLLIFLYAASCGGELYAQTSMRIRIIPMGEVDSGVINNLQEKLPETFNAIIAVAAQEPLPAYAFDRLRNQYSTYDILNRMKGHARQPGTIILAVIDADLYAPGINFVFGQADQQYRDCIISTTRLRQSFYGLPDDEDLFLTRSLKEAIHELGHVLGLPHCPNPQCVMFFSNQIEDTDQKEVDFCDLCHQAIKNKIANYQ